MNNIPTHSAEAFAKSGILLLKKHLYTAALTCFEKASSMQPENHEFYYLIGNALWTMKRFDEAEPHLLRTLANNPKYVPARHILALVKVNQCKFAEADKLFGECLEEWPDCSDVKLDYALSKLYWGDLAGGFRAFDIRTQYLKGAYVDDENCPVWDGVQDIRNKTLYVYAEQGIGDTIQFSRYLPWLAQNCGRLIFAAPSELIGLFRAFPKSVISELIVRQIGGPIPNADYNLPLVSAAKLMKTTVETIPSDPGYFRILASHQSFDLPQPQDGVKKIGICWSGNPTHARDRERSIALEHFLKLAETDKVVLYAFQVGQRANDVDMIGAQPLVCSLGGELTDWSKTAAAMMQLDLFVTCDTAVAHLGGALGVPTWLAIPKEPDWRWLSGRDSTPWYPSVRLFRQTVSGQWSSVFDEMRSALSDLITSE